TWNLAPQHDIQSIVIESSTNGQQFSQLYDADQELLSAQNKYVHRQVENNMTFYRLKMTDAQAHVTFSNIIKVNNSCNSSKIKYFLNDQKELSLSHLVTGS